MIHSTQIARLDGLPLCASVDDEQAGSALAEVKGQVKLVMRRLNRNSEPQASIESGAHYSIHYLVSGDVAYTVVADRSYPRRLAFTYLADLAAEFSNSYPPHQLASPTLRPYAFMEFDTFIGRTKALYSDARAASAAAGGGEGGGGGGGAGVGGIGPGGRGSNIDRLNDGLRDVTKVMTKNIEDLLYRGDSLERMGELSSRLRDDSKKYRRAAVNINWNLLVKQYAPFGVLGLIIIVFIWIRFF